ncbi:MAG: TonB-dependent receptor [Dissulfurispiraceae bacterium]
METLLSMDLKDLMNIEVISATRSLIPLSETAENITVITAKDIEFMNAHTLADVLLTVNGVQLNVYMGSPGTISLPHIQGSDLDQVLVMIDGIVINELTDNIAVIGSIPVQNIERIEIIKGPASSAWGSSLGGVINVITKSGDLNSKPSGTVAASYGEKNTYDFKGDVSGGTDKLGYYLYTGTLHTDGLLPFQHAFSNSTYTKVSYKIAENTDIKFTLLYNNESDEVGNWPAIDDLYYKNVSNSLFATATLTTKLNEDLQAIVSLRTALQNFNYIETIYSTGADYGTYKEEDSKNGASAKLLWSLPNQQVVIGSDFDYWVIKESDFTNGNQNEAKWAIFTNDTISLGKFTVTPGIRMDSTKYLSSFFSPSLGMTYALGDKTILRLYAGRGFNDPSVGELYGDSQYYRHNANLKPEEVWSYQPGVETRILEYLWLKATFFCHNIRNGLTTQILDPNTWTYTYVNTEKIRRQGEEIELRTVPFYNLTLAAAASFIKTTDLTTGEKVMDYPTSTYSVSLQYDDKKSLKALIKGYYIWENAQSYYEGKYNSMLFDVNVSKKLYKGKDSTVEAYLTGHNIFDGAQYTILEYANARRWFEGGLRYKF